MGGRERADPDFFNRFGFYHGLAAYHQAFPDLLPLKLLG
jgi:hypothetical protein